MLPDTGKDSMHEFFKSEIIWENFEGSAGVYDLVAAFNASTLANSGLPQITEAQKFLETVNQLSNVKSRQVAALAVALARYIAKGVLLSAIIPDIEPLHGSRVFVTDDGVATGSV